MQDSCAWSFRDFRVVAAALTATSLGVSPSMKFAQPILKLGSLSPGDVVAVPLPNGQFAHGRIYRNAIGIYQGLCDGLRPVEGFKDARPKRFFCYMSMHGGGRYLKDWRFIGNVPFTLEEDTYAPPMHVRDNFGLSGTRIYHRGTFRGGLQHPLDTTMNHTRPEALPSLGRSANDP
jgi:hypothetical protein